MTCLSLGATLWPSPAFEVASSSSSSAESLVAPPCAIARRSSREIAWHTSWRPRAPHTRAGGPTLTPAGATNTP